MSTENIEKFLQTAYSDEKLAALLAHAQDGKLAYNSCCCLIGVPTAKHSLKGERDRNLAWLKWEGDIKHHMPVRSWPFAKEAEREFSRLGHTDSERREKLIPLIIAEMNRRTLDRIADNLPDISLEEQHRLEDIDAERESLDAHDPEPTYGRRL